MTYHMQMLLVGNVLLTGHTKLAGASCLKMISRAYLLKSVEMHLLFAVGCAQQGQKVAEELAGKLLDVFLRIFSNYCHLSNVCLGETVLSDDD
jgi:hypothetical protein